MLTKQKLKQLTLCSMTSEIINDYKRAAMELIVNCTGDLSLFDFYGMEGSQGTIAQMLANYGAQSLSAMVNQSGSDFVVQGSSQALTALGALNSIAVVYYPDEKDMTKINTALCTANCNLFSTLTSMGAIQGVTKGAEDRKLNTTISRLSIPTMKSVSGTKANVFKDILYGNKNKQLVYSGPLLKFGDVDSNVIEFSYTNCNGIPIESALFVPLVFYFILEDIFFDVFTTDGHKGMTSAAIATSVEKSKKLLKLLADDKRTTNGVWKSLPVARDRSITLSENVLRKVYGKETDELVQKINRIKPQLGFTLSLLKFSFYDLRGAYDSYEPQRIDPLTFRCLSDYSKKQFTEDVGVIRSTSKYPKFVLVSIYRESVDNLMTKKIDAPSFWQSLHIPEEVLANAKFGDEHKNYVYGAFKFTSSDLYILMSKNAAIFGDIDGRAKQRLAQFNMSNFKRVKISLSEDCTKRLVEVKKALNAGVCFVDYQNKKGGVNRHTLTTNETIIKKIYGDDYVGKYGSLKKRIETMRYGIENAKSLADINYYINKTGIMDLAGIEVKDKYGKVIGTNPNFPVISEDFEAYKRELNSYLDNLCGQSGVSRSKPDDIPPEKQTVFGVSLAATPKNKSADIEGSKDFYSFLEIGGIVGLYVLR